MQINKVMSLLDILTSWLEDNINMESDLFFDNDVDNTTSESLYPAVEKAIEQTGVTVVRDDSGDASAFAGRGRRQRGGFNC